METSLRAKMVITLIAEFNKSNYLRTHLREEKRTDSDLDKNFRYPEHLSKERVDLDNFSMELLKWNDKNELFEKPSDKVILQLHGGGYIGAFKNIYRTMAGLYGEVSCGADVLSIDYRVGPEFKHPAALEDAFCAYNWLLDNGYTEDKIVFAGDSAGGGLAMALCHLLKDKGRKLPRAIVAMSPWTDLLSTGASYKDNYDVDPVFGNDSSNLIYDNPYVEDIDRGEKYISPLYGDFEGFPPMLIQVGSNEMLLDDSKLVAEKAKEAGVQVKLSIYDGMFHVFQMGAKLMPESMKAWNEVSKFFDVLG
ncbi:MAG: alpha/beta hydrolase [Lachnospiraceae bacterium]|nr:alpha/beta hydrolase [Lachnospiraceae bacterium]MBQ9233989.1 alpha/beta hydrolase [Lachnospiraceae bacterium]